MGIVLGPTPPALFSYFWRGVGELFVLGAAKSPPVVATPARSCSSSSDGACSPNDDCSPNSSSTSSCKSICFDEPYMEADAEAEPARTKGTVYGWRHSRSSDMSPIAHTPRPSTPMGAACTSSPFVASPASFLSRAPSTPLADHSPPPPPPTNTPFASSEAGGEEALRAKLEIALELLGEREETLEDLRSELQELRTIYREHVTMLVAKAAGAPEQPGGGKLGAAAAGTHSP
ncbi:hypothetical protein TSOC_005950 [Tetrabaena socialis]|uniref:TATA element modulatory factor 1 TATA binding domain-containing protein n=1 Tax=Tetrabaena socialis TaxID=47790 RepID=A0A2J8A513_9CHLO|nr:hypothetical protein TSOC_005950 [Tetrabaena socialis]|eukprot:PNH07606.1 hypothetical protein TSOC_005950 [Tetrabaena socialis]